METNPLEAAASVLQLYKIKQADNFFFTSKFVDDRAKIAARKVAFPTWKRPGTAITYYQAAMDFGTAGYDDAALESYYSALIMTEGLNAYPMLVYSLREHIYDGLAQLQTKLGNPGSALLFTQMSELYKELFNSSTLKDRNKAFEKMSNEVTNYFGKIEETAMNARQKKRSALFNAIGGIAMASASAVNDGANGLTELSSQTQQLTTAAADNANVVGDFKTNSLAASREAAQAFNDIYGDVVKQLQANKSEVGTERPVITTDFIKRLGDKELSAEKKDAFIAFAGKITLVQDDVKKYYEAATDDERSSLLKGIFKKLATAEMSIFIKESMGENPGKQFLTVAN